jgi:uncharacterized protein YdaU (DUF1376 family)
VAAKWQQWMPWYIDRFMASRYVQDMHPSAQMGYLYLIAAQWQSDDCCLPDDEEDLAVLSGLKKWNLWTEFSKAILRQFPKTESGKRQNAVCSGLWLEAKRIFEARQSGRKGKTHTSVKHQSSKKSDTRTVTGTVTRTKEQKPSGKPGADPRHPVFHEQIDRYWKHKTGEEKAPWDGSEGKALSALLAAKPDLTLEQFRIALKHRGDSPDEVQTERPRQWLPNLLRFSGGPLDRFGKPLHPTPQAPVRRYANEVHA